MDALRLERIQELFHAALERSPAERRSFLEAACGSDAELLTTVERYLEADSAEFELLDEPVRLSKGHQGGTPSADLAGTTVGSYRVERLIGQGGMATVYLAEDLKHDRKVALKVLRPDLAAAVGAERFLAEIRTTARLQHPLVLPLFDSGEMDGSLFFVMPYVEGESLKQRIQREGALPLTDAVRILKEVADGLAYAHQQGLIHRDIKPGNILLSGRHAVIADFGVAKALTAQVRPDAQTATGMIVGTFGYMAPEQAGAEPDLGPEVDVYALGVLAYEMLTGTLPFAGSGMRELLSRQLSTDPSPVETLRGDVPDALAETVMRCLERDPADRWPNGAELARQLEAIPSDSVETAASGVRLAPARRPWPPAPVLVGAVVLAAAVGLALLRPFGSEGGPEAGPPAAGETDADASPLVAVAVFENQTGDATLDPMGRVLADEITNSLLRTGRVRVVSSEAARRFATVAEAGGSDAPREAAAALSQGTGAALLVAGSYFVAGDSLRVRAQVMDGTTLEVLASPAAAVAPATDPWTGVAAATSLAVTAAAQRFDVRLGDLVDVLSVPRSFMAYEEYSAGMDAFLDTDYTGAKRHFQRAVEEDPTYADARLYLAVTHLNLGERPEWEAQVLLVEENLSDLSPLSRAFAELHRSWLNGDREGAYRATKRGTELAVSGNWAYQLGSEAIRVNRPQEAYDVLTGLDPESPHISGWSPYWSRLVEATHILERHEEELEKITRAVELYPQRVLFRWYLLRARVATGQGEEVVREIPAFLEQWRAPFYALGIAYELRAHGQPELAHDALIAALTWLDSRPPAEQATAVRRRYRGELLYRLGRSAEAREILMALREENPDDLNVLGVLGLVVASLDDEDELQEVDRALADFDRPYVFGVNTLWRARMAGIRGDAASAVALIRQAHEEGWQHGSEIHRYSEFDPVRDAPAFQDLVRPKG